MLKYARIPLLFLFIGSLLGVFLRWQFIDPTPGINYTFFLHGHSHIMFLGWVFNVLYIAFTQYHIAESGHKIFERLFIILQVLVVGMLVAFPLQGYAFYSILFSTLHTFVAIAYCILFFQKTKNRKNIPLWFARVALVFFIVANAGPFFLAYFMANGMAHTNWYYYSIYFYLHFQYNGFFLFGIFSLFFSLLESKGIAFDQITAKRLGIILVIACIPAYLLSTLWSEPGVFFNVAGGISAFIQLYVLILIAKLLRENMVAIRENTRKASLIFLGIVLLSFSSKLLLQLISAFPEAAQLAYEARPLVIAYLHLVLLGIITLFLFVWYAESGMLVGRSFHYVVTLFFIAFAGMEICLVASPWWSLLFGISWFSSAEFLLLFSVLLAVCVFLILRSPLITLIKVSR